jgi:hypothetical protein
VSDADSLMSVYDSDGKEVLSNETANFIDNAIKGIPPKKELHLYQEIGHWTYPEQQMESKEWLQRQCGK